MKQFLTLIVSVFVIVVLAAPISSAQSVKTLKTRGPMFITSAAFFQSLTRLPYNVEPGAEYAIYNGKKANISNFAISQFFGFQFNPYLALGAGVGFELWTNNKSGFVPLYVDLRVNIIEGKIAPHWYMNAGYAPRWHIDNRPYNTSTGTGKMYLIHGYTSGWMGETGIGLKASISRTSAILVTVSGKVQESSLRYHSGVDPTPGLKPLLVNTNSHGMYISIGMKASFVF